VAVAAVRSFTSSSRSSCSRSFITQPRSIWAPPAMPRRLPRPLQRRRLRRHRPHPRLPLRRLRQRPLRQRRPRPRHPLQRHRQRPRQRLPLRQLRQRRLSSGNFGAPPKGGAPPSRQPDISRARPSPIPIARSAIDGFSPNQLDRRQGRLRRLRLAIAECPLPISTPYRLLPISHPRRVASSRCGRAGRPCRHCPGCPS
jgi:hypothetical protein